MSKIPPLVLGKHPIFEFVSNKPFSNNRLYLDLVLYIFGTISNKPFSSIAVLYCTCAGFLFLLYNRQYLSVTRYMLSHV